MNCLICDRIKLIEENNNPYFVTELETGYVVLGDHQRFKGYTLFLCKKHVTELHHLEHQNKMKFLEEMSLIAQAVQQAFNAEKMNYELLGNGDTHLHWHLFPRNSGDTPTKGPVWWLPKEELWNDKYRPSKEELDVLKEKLKVEIEKLKNNTIQSII
ncbi:MAG: HIT family protein [Clostridia bacterium]|nr:HIT family protein [Clostridia bacterium]